MNTSKVMTPYIAAVYYRKLLFRKFIKKPSIIYKAYRFMNGYVIDNINEQIEGKFKIHQKINDQIFISEELENPTWLDICFIVNELLEEIGEKRNLEGIKIVDNKATILLSKFNYF